MKFCMYTLYVDGNPVINFFSGFPDFFPIFPPIIPIFNFSGISGPKNRGNGVNYGKTGRYVISPLLSSIVAKTEWKKLFYNSRYWFFSFGPILGWFGQIWWRHHHMGDLIVKIFISTRSLHDVLSLW